MAGGSPAAFRAIVSEAVARALLRRAGIWRGLRVGRPRRLDKDEFCAAAARLLRAVIRVRLGRRRRLALGAIP